MCLVSDIPCHMSHVTCRQPQPQTLPLLNPMHNRLAHKDPENPKKLKCKNHWIGKIIKTFSCRPILVIHSSTRSLQSIGKRGFQTRSDRQVTDIATYRLNSPRGRCSDNPKISAFIFFFSHVIYHVSCVTCHMSCVMYHMSCVLLLHLALSSSLCLERMSRCICSPTPQSASRH